MLAPTRELCVQTAETARKIAALASDASGSAAPVGALTSAVEAIDVSDGGPGAGQGAGALLAAA